jgi:adenosylmethionine-8-amino-7-oxononanoate aminotransferase
MPTLAERQAQFAAAFNLSYEQYLQVVKSCNITEVIAILELVKQKNHKSTFRRVMADRLHRWFTLGVETKPFSEREFKALMPTWPVKWKLPT